MRHQYLCIAAILTAAVAADAALHRPQAKSVRLAGSTENSPVYSMTFRRYRWVLPEFRMAGKSAFIIVRIENTHEHDLQISMTCRTPDQEIPQMTGRHVLAPGEFMQVDTRKLRSPLQKGKGVRVKCRFRADASAKVETWIFDENMKRAGHGPPARAFVRG